MPQLATLQLLLRQPARQIVLPLLAALLLLLSINRADNLPQSATLQLLLR
jgi:hypothetical protein